MDTGLVLLRAVIGLTLLAHGTQKFSGLDGAATSFEGLGFVPGRRSAIVAGLAEQSLTLPVTFSHVTSGNKHGAVGAGVRPCVLTGPCSRRAHWGRRREQPQLG